MYRKGSAIIRNGSALRHVRRRPVYVQIAAADGAEITDPAEAKLWKSTRSLVRCNPPRSRCPLLQKTLNLVIVRWKRIRTAAYPRRLQLTQIRSICLQFAQNEAGKHKRRAVGSYG